MNLTNDYKEIKEIVIIGIGISEKNGLNLGLKMSLHKNKKTAHLKLPRNIILLLAVCCTMSSKIRWHSHDYTFRAYNMFKILLFK